MYKVCVCEKLCAHISLCLGTLDTWILMGFWNCTALQGHNRDPSYRLFLCRPDLTLIWHQRRSEHASATYFNDFSQWSDSYSNMNHVCSIFVFARALVFCTLAAGWHSSAPHLHGAGPAQLQSLPPVRLLALGKVRCTAKHWIRHHKGLGFIDRICWGFLSACSKILWVRQCSQSVRTHWSDRRRI